MQEESCCGLDNVVSLSKDTMKNSIEEKIKALAVGGEIHFKGDHDFSKTLIEVLNEHFSDLPLKARFMEEGPSNWIIKIKYPKEGEGCCGSCG